MNVIKDLYPGLAAKGFTVSGNLCYGMWRGYQLTLNPSSRRDVLVRFAVRVDKNDKALRQNLLRSLRERLGKTVTSVLNQGKLLVVGLRLDGKSDPAQQFFAFVDAAAQVLAGMGIPPAGSCVICGGGTPESLCFTDSYQPVHAACVRQSAADLRSKAEENRSEGSYLSGLLGAVIGAIVGAIPSIALLLGTNYFSAWLFTLVPLAAMFGYRKLNGKNDKLGIVIVILTSLLAVFLIFTSGVVAEVMKAFQCGVGAALSIMGAYFSDILKMVIGDYLKGLFFMALGIVISWSYLSKTGASQVKMAENVLATLRPNPRYAEVPYPGSAEPSEQDPLR